jgi:hypothetical protein
MPMSAIRQPVTPPDEHILTVQEALEPLFMKLEQEVDVQLIDAAVDAGWSAEDALTAIEELRKH